MIPIDTVKTVAALLLAAFFAWNWWGAEREISRLVAVGSSLGSGWEQCVDTLATRTDSLAREISAAVRGP